MNYKTIILPILSTLAIFIQLVFGVTIPEDVVSDLAVVIGNAILIGFTLVGIFKNHKKEGK